AGDRDDIASELFGKGFGHDEHPSTRKDQILTGKVSIKPSAVPTSCSTAPNWLAQGVSGA
ncbi:hypothetical protein, partial [Arthrobacter sp. BL-252-APC-1A]|uniref:hypothetical protein n=1 Tax=Arthrobacter sp. BL-252-APC-1A TaxID=2606622 RepID=UPI001E3C9EBC